MHYLSASWISGGRHILSRPGFPLFALGAVLLAPPAAMAQLVPDGGTAVLSGVVTNITGTLTIGTNGSFTTLIITNSGIVTNTGNGTIGNNAAARTNRVIVTGTNSVWSGGAILYVGLVGSYNLLLVTNGGRVINSQHGNISSGTGASNNAVIVTDAGSSWTNLGVAFHVGTGGAYNRLTVSNGAVVRSAASTVGNNVGAAGNIATVTGTGSLWTCTSTLEIGADGARNQLLISSGGRVRNTIGTLGTSVSASSNLVVVRDAASLWTNQNDLVVGDGGSFNQLIVTNGGWVANLSASIGNMGGSRSNSVIVSDPGSVWTNRSNLYLGRTGEVSQLTVRNSGLVLASNLFLGFEPASSNNATIVSGGSVIVTNTSAAGRVDVRRGSFTLNSGSAETDKLLLTNGAAGQFTFNGGLLRLRSAFVSNSLPFAVGNNFIPATLELHGNGTNAFANGIQIAAQSLLKGVGTIFGSVTNLAGATISPGTSIGTLAVAGHLELATGSTSFFEINSSGSRDQITGLSSVRYGGTLVVTNLSGTLTAGRIFKLFSATTYAGVFDDIVLPPLPSGLVWRNTLLVDGSIEVIVPPPTPYTTVIPFGADWKYLDDGSDQGTAWTAPGFNDTGWSNGLAELGYGDGDETTVVSYGPDPLDKHITTYFRKSFVIGNSSPFSGYLLRVVRDDGVVVHLNGSEVFRDNLPAGPVGYLTQTPTFVEDFPLFRPVSALLGPVLRPGTNVLAVEIHQNLVSSSDISFDLELLAVPVNLAAGATRLWSGAGTDALWSNPANWQGNVAPQSGDSLVFPAGAARLTNTNDFPGGLIVHSLSFETDGYVLRGGELKLLSGITNSAAAGTNALANSGLAILQPSHLAVTSPMATLLLPEIDGIEFDLTCHNEGRLQAAGFRGHSALVKNGPGLLWLDGASHSGSTVANGGTLALDGATNSPLVELTGGATLAGTGNYQAIHVHSGVLSPGRSLGLAVGVGIITVSNLVFDPAPAATTLRIELSSGGDDQIRFSGLCDLGGAVFELQPSRFLLPGETRTNILRVPLFSGSDIVGTFRDLPQNGLLHTTNGCFQIAYLPYQVMATRITIENFWTGAGTNTLWSNPANWEDPCVPAVGDAAVFPAVAQRTVMNDLPAETSLSFIRFTTDGYVLGGNSLAVRRLIADQAGGTNHLLARIRVGLSGVTEVPNNLIVSHTSGVLELAGGVVSAASPTLVVNSGTLRITGDLECLHFTYDGPGVLEINGESAKSGVVFIRTGSIHVEGNHTNLGFYPIGGSLHAAGSVQYIYTLEAPPSSVSAGSSPDLPGILLLKSLIVGSNTTFKVDLRGDQPGTGYDQIRTILPPAAYVQLSGAKLLLNLGYNPPAATSHLIIDNGSSHQTAYTFAGLPEGATLTNQGAVFSITYTGGDGNDVVLTRVNDAMDLSTPGPQPDGSLVLEGQGLPGWSFIIECATNLAPPVLWIPVSTNVADASGHFQFVTGTTNGESRFYRARAASAE